jgi:hypothetical protein
MPARDSRLKTALLLKRRSEEVTAVRPSPMQAMSDMGGKGSLLICSILHMASTRSGMEASGPPQPRQRVALAAHSLSSVSGCALCQTDKGGENCD